MLSTQKQDIILKFLEKGHLLTEDALEFLEVYGESNSSNQNKLMLTQDDFNNGVKVLKNITTEHLSSDKIVNEYQKRYQKLREIIVARYKKDFTSVKRMQKAGESWIVVLVKSVDSKTVEVEDSTASVQLTMADEIFNLDTDDVVAIRVNSENNTLYCKEVIYPDVPLRQPTRGHGKACFISDLNLNEAPQADIEAFFNWLELEDVEHVFVSGNVGSTEEFSKLVNNHCYGKKIFVIPEHRKILGDKYENDKITSLSNPSMVKLNGLNILLTNDFDQSMLKKRYINKGRNLLADLVLDEVPDIVHYGYNEQQQPAINNYKSITIVNSGSLLAVFKPIIIHFDSREAIFADWRQLNADAGA